MDGDLRIIKLANMFAKDNNIVYTYGLEKADELKKKENIIFCSKLDEAMQKAQIIVGPIPFSSDGREINAPFSNNQITVGELTQKLEKKMLIAGAIAPHICEIMQYKNCRVVDIMKKEEVAILNAISTAEGAIQVMIQNTDTIIHGSKILILGFGRITKVLAKKLEGLSAKVTCTARKSEDLSWIRAYGYNYINTNEIEQNLSQYDIIINTIPNMILNKEKLQYVRKDTLLLDLASNPGGIDREEAKNKQLKLIWALALPGKVAPVTTAEIIKDAIYSCL